MFWLRIKLSPNSPTMTISEKRKSSQSFLPESLLLLLPEYFILELLVFWIDFSYLSIIDASFTNRAGRFRFLKLLSCDHIPFEFQVKKPSVMKYLKARCIKPKSLWLSSGCFENGDIKFKIDSSLIHH